MGLKIAQGKGAILGVNLERPIVTKGTLWRSYSLLCQVSNVDIACQKKQKKYVLKQTRNTLSKNMFFSSLDGDEALPKLLWDFLLNLLFNMNFTIFCYLIRLAR